jgi:Ran GTPase-activating protein (RanGAP) involved in mRNA processing and transport
VIGASLKEKMKNTDDMGEFCNGEEYKIIGTKERMYTAAMEAYLKYFYSNKENKDLTPFKLARIEKKKANRGECDSFTRSTLRGDQDDMVYSKEPMDEEGVAMPAHLGDGKQPRLILIEGAAGVGKTTFSEQFCLKWSWDQVLNHRLLVLLPLRDSRVWSAKNVSDFFHHPELQQEIAEGVSSTGGEGVVLWLEAWDELGEEMRNESSIFLDIVHGRVLPKATVIITSRPWATKNLRENSSIKIDQHVEIVSTPDIQFNRVLREGKWQSQLHGLSAPEPHHESKFKDYVENNPSIKAFMHTPVTADIVAEVFQWSRETESTPPTTMTQMYAAFTCNLLMQHLSSRTGGFWRIKSLDEAPTEVKGRLLEMCRLAWDGIVKQQLTFGGNFEDGDTLGLMHRVKELYGGENGQVSYNFIHLSLQEFLSAYHLTQLPLREQEQIIRDHVDVGHLIRVVRFYFGLTKSNRFTSEMISEHLSDGATVYHWLFEADDVKTIAAKLGSGRVVRVKSSYSWSPLDYYVLGHSVAHYQFQWELDCERASMGDEGLEMLSKGMASSKERSWNGKIDCILAMNDISLEGIKWFVEIPPQLAQQMFKLDFEFNKLDSNALNAFCEFVPKLTKLQELTLHGNKLISKGGSIRVLNFLRQQKNPLKELKLGDTGVGDEDCAELGSFLAHSCLEELSIEHNDLSHDGVASIIEGVAKSTTIQFLSMESSPFLEANCRSMASVLEQQGCRLRRLEIRSCKINGKDAAILAAALVSNHSLRGLDMAYNPIGTAGAGALGDMLKSNKTLRRLCIAWCEITSEGCITLAEGLTENTSLQVLRMGGNHVGAEGAKALGQTISKNKSLKKIWLSDDTDNSLGEGVDSLLAGLQSNTTLENLYLPKQYERSADSRVIWKGEAFIMWTAPCNKTA